MLQTVIYSRVMDPTPKLIEPSLKVRVLVVDDNTTIRSACEEVARTLGYAAESTSDRQAARTLACRHLVDILLLNVPPGDAGCLELVSEIRTLCPQVVIIGMTTSATLNSIIDAMRLGASDYLMKPFAVDELSTVLERAAATFASFAGANVTRGLAPNLGIRLHDRPFRSKGEALPHSLQGCRKHSSRPDPG
jgi:two-component system response regulator HydG